jgi:ubiquitin C-terminal hydrolase
MVCFLGNHYVTYVKQLSAWKLYDDQKPVKVYQ